LFDVKQMSSRAKESQNMTPRLTLAITAVLVVAVTASMAGEPELASESRLPEFSWDTLPLYIHIRKADAFTEEELKFLASFPLITLEKTTGVRSSGSTDHGTIDAAVAIKKLNPRAKVLFYRNVFVHYGGYSFDEKLKNIEKPFLVDKRGKTRLVRGTHEGYDLSNPEVVDWWVDSATTVCNHRAIDGLFLDGNVKVLTSYLAGRLPAGKKAATIEGYHELMKRTRSGLPKSNLMIANLIRARFPDSGLKYMNYFDGSYLEGFTHSIGDVTEADYIAKGIEATQKAARDGKIIAMSFGLGESAAAADGIDDTRAKLNNLKGLEKRVDYLVGLFLVCAERHSYLCLHDGYAADTRRGRSLSRVWLKRFPQYDKPLGPPCGPAGRKGYVFSRQFEHATVTLDLEKRDAEIVWSSEGD